MSREHLRTHRAVLASAAIGAGALAGCASRSNDESGPTADATATETEPPAETTTGEPTARPEPSYSVTMKPVGTVEFEDAPERCVPFTGDYADMGVALGQGDGLAGIRITARPAPGSRCSPRGTGSIPSCTTAGEWADCDPWREWFDDELGGVDVSRARIEGLHERYIDRVFDTRLSPEEVDERRERGHRRPARQLDTDAVLDAIDDEETAAYLADRDSAEPST